MDRITFSLTYEHANYPAQHDIMTLTSEVPGSLFFLDAIEYFLTPVHSIRMKYGQALLLVYTNGEKPTATINGHEYLVQISLNGTIISHVSSYALSLGDKFTITKEVHGVMCKEHYEVIGTGIRH